MEPEPAPQAAIKAEQLPPQLAAQLNPATRDALGHPVRRQILRVLNESSEPRSPGEIATTILPDTSVGVVNYHARVLQACDSIALTGTRQLGGSIALLYASKVAGDEQVAAVLRATRELDRWTEDPR
jgi:DNA-binding transcriptional ArsR family regulator